MEENGGINYVQNLNSTIMKTFFRMFLGLLATGIAAYVTYSTGTLFGISFPVLAIIEVAVVLLFTFLFRKLSPVMVTLLYYTYAIINGVTMSIIFYLFDIETIFYAFFATSALFGALAFVGYKTNKDLTKFGTILTTTLFVGIIVSLINLFLDLGAVAIALDWVMLFVFAGLVMYDMQKIKTMHEMVDCNPEKLYVYCAMDLYLDFINIFIRMLSLFARFSRDD